MTIKEFAQTIKQKYPQYSSIDDAELANKVLSKYPQYKNMIGQTNKSGKFEVPETQQDQQSKLAKYQSDAAESKKKADYASSPLGWLSNFGKSLVGNIASSEVNLANTISGIANTQNLPTYTKNVKDLTDINVKTLKQINDYEKVGKDATMLKKQYNQTQSLINENVNKIKELQGGLSKTKSQVAGEIGGVGLDVLTAGSYGNAAKGLKTGVLGTKNASTIKSLATAVSPELGQISQQTSKGLFTKLGAKNIASGAGIGYGYDVSQNLQQGKSGIEAFTPGVGTALGATIPFASEIGQTVKNLKNPTLKTNAIIEKRVNALQKIEDNNSVVRRTIENSSKKGIDVKNILANTDLLKDSVDNTGTLRTKNAIEELTNFIKPQEDVISTVLQKEGKKIPLKKVESELISAINSSKLTGSGKVSAINGVKKEIAGLRLDADKNGNIPLEIIHNAKVNKYTNINYFIPESKVSDKLIAKTFKELVEKNTTSADVKRLNGELSQHFAVLDLLEKLDGKKVEGGKLGKYFASTIGSIVGSHFGPLGSIVGAELGGSIRGKQMSSTFSGNLGTKLNQSPEMEKVLQSVQNQSKNLGSLKTIQSKDTIPINNSIISNTIKQKTPKVKGFNSAEVTEKLVAVKSSLTSENINMNDLISIKKESQSSLKNASKYIENSLSGKGESRKPLTAIQLSNGKKLIIDGNATYQSLKGKVNDVPVETINPINTKTKQPYTDSQIADAVKLYQIGSENVKPFDKFIKKMSSDIGIKQMTEDTTYKVKPLESILEKKYSRNEPINDLNRDTLILENNDQNKINQVITWLKKNGASDFNTERRPALKNRLLTASTGYRDVNYQFKLPDGNNYELQIIGKNMAKAKQEIGHYIYNITEKDLDRKPKLKAIKDELEKFSNVIYDKAFDADQNGKAIDSFVSMAKIGYSDRIKSILNGLKNLKTSNTEAFMSILG